MGVGKLAFLEFIDEALGGRADPAGLRRSGTPRCQTISMCPAACYTAQFVFEHRATVPTLVRDKTLVIDQGHCVYSIHLYDSPAIGETSGGEFDAFVGSLHLA